jgi:hypothetical protein
VEELRRKSAATDAESGQMSKLTLLPWQGIESPELEKQLKKEVYALAKDRDTLTMCDA